MAISTQKRIAFKPTGELYDAIRMAAIKRRVTVQLLLNEALAKVFLKKVRK